MKLSIEQITKIEDTLVLNGIKFQDIKLELTDHIASEIEEKIAVENADFDIAFKHVFESWKNELRSSGSWWIGVYSAPKIVVDKWVKIAKQQQLKSLLIAVIPAFSITLIIRCLENIHFANLVCEIYKIGFSILSVLVVLSRIYIWKSKNKTILSHIFKTSSNAVGIWLILYGFELLPIKVISPNLWFNAFLNCYILTLFTYHILLLELVYKHFKFQRNITIFE